MAVLEIENGRTSGVPREERICRLCHIEIEDEYHFTCKCLTYAEIRAKCRDNCQVYGARNAP